MSEGGTTVPTPYFPGSAGLLLAIEMMAGEWDEFGEASLARYHVAPGFPADWKVKLERFGRCCDMTAGMRLYWYDWRIGSQPG